MKESIKTKKSGFTLVETLVAISVLSLSILGAFTAVQSGLQKSNYVKDQIVAFYLAQEAMEYIHNIRDRNALLFINGTATDWLSGLSGNTGADPCRYDNGSVCRIDSPAGTITNCGGAFGSCPFLKQDSNFLFGYISGSDTRFKREVKFDQVDLMPTSREIMVTVRISWGSNTFQVNQLFMNNRF